MNVKSAKKAFIAALAALYLLWVAALASLAVFWDRAPRPLKSVRRQT